MHECKVKALFLVLDSKYSQIFVDLFIVPLSIRMKHFIYKRTYGRREIFHKLFGKIGFEEKEKAQVRVVLT